MNSPVTLVTAYFNIGREQFKAVPRSEDRYLEEFKFWARIRNPLVVFTEPRCADRILSIRAEFGLVHLTTIIEVPDLFAIEPSILGRMREVSRSQLFRDFRLLPDATSGIAEYSYLMLLKSWFLKEAVAKGHAGDTLAWIDFSYNRGGLVYSDPTEFAFEWSSPAIERVVLFTMNDYDDRPIFEIVRRLSDCIMGSPIVLPATLADILWQSNRAQMEILLSVGLIDDDQLIQMMSFRASPEHFELRRSTWFRPLDELTGQNLTLTPTKSRGPFLSFARSCLHLVRRRRRAAASAFKLYRNLTSDET